MIAAFPTQPGTVLRDRYILQEVLYSGHWSLTLRARRQPDNKWVILKVPGPGSAQSGASLAFHAAWMQRVFHSLSSIHHPHRVAVLDYLESHGYPVLVQQDVAGKPLSHRIVKAPLGEREAIALIRKIAIALSGVHGKGLIHRNVRPETILERTGEEAKGLRVHQLGQPILTDWGLQPSVFSANRASSYAAPEQFQPGGRFQPSIDVYGLAGTLYAMVTGQPPQHGALREKAPLILPRQVRPELSVALERAIVQGMALHPQERPPSMGAWLALLPEVAMPPVAQSLGPPDRSAAAAENRVEQPVVATGTGSVASTGKTINTVDTKVADNSADAASPSSSPNASFPRKPMRTLALISLTASIFGSLGGLALRIATPESVAGISSIGRTQTFPEQDWPGAERPEAVPFDTPLVEPGTAPESSFDDFDDEVRSIPNQGGEESLREVVGPEEAEAAPILSPREELPQPADGRDEGYYRGEGSDRDGRFDEDNDWRDRGEDERRERGDESVDNDRLNRDRLDPGSQRDLERGQESLDPTAPSTTPLTPEAAREALGDREPYRDDVYRDPYNSDPYNTLPAAGNDAVNNGAESDGVESGTAYPDDPGYGIGDAGYGYGEVAPEPAAETWDAVPNEAIYDDGSYRDEAVYSDYPE